MEKDRMLCLAIKLCVEMNDPADPSTKTSVILHVNGMLVAGQVISAREFLTNDPITNGIVEYVKNSCEGDPPLPNVPGKVGEDLPDYIHLSGVKFFIPGARSIPVDGHDNVFWRCRIADVSGFSFGILATLAD